MIFYVISSFIGEYEAFYPFFYNSQRYQAIETKELLTEPKYLFFHEKLKIFTYVCKLMWSTFKIPKSQSCD